MSFTTHTLPILANWSQFIGGVPLLFAVFGLMLKHNCYRHGCFRVARVRGEDGHTRCKRHHREHVMVKHPAIDLGSREELGG